MEAASNWSPMGRFLLLAATERTAETLFRTGRFLPPAVMERTAETSFRTGRFLRPAVMGKTAETCGWFSSGLQKQTYSGLLAVCNEVGVWP
jgi:hypothetical protein